jgi:hypothetical protein
MARMQCEEYDPAPPDMDAIGVRKMIFQSFDKASGKFSCLGEKFRPFEDWAISGTMDATHHTIIF